MVFAELLGIAYLGLALNLTYRKEVQLPQGTKYFVNF